MLDHVACAGLRLIGELMDSSRLQVKAWHLDEGWSEEKIREDLLIIRQQALRHIILHCDPQLQANVLNTVSDQWGVGGRLRPDYNQSHFIDSNVISGHITLVYSFEKMVDVISFKPIIKILLIKVTRSCF